MTVAFVLAGGGSLAAVQVGMMQALSERGVRPEFVVGTSAGALNAAYVAGYGTGTASAEWLDAGADAHPAPERSLSLHAHGPRSTRAPRVSTPLR